ncbi:MAG: RHS repeat-associated core domain-containing protein [Armatimonadetes bacterium]|nr:RHS repeat-associated core domain-containing protein [Armatimonadota bacterium]
MMWSGRRLPAGRCTTSHQGSVSCRPLGTVSGYARGRLWQGDTLTAVYTHGNALLHRNSEYPLYDGPGNERTVTNGSETVTGTINFEAFGQTAGTTGSSSSPYMYAGAWGYRTDGDAGLMHVGARYYDFQVGRFITRDTVLSEHPYLYCEHDPVNAVDPSGHEMPTKRFWYWVGAGGCIACEIIGGFRSGQPLFGLIVAAFTLTWAYNSDPGGPWFGPDPISTGPMPYYGADPVGPPPSGSFAAVHRAGASEWFCP